MSGKVSIRTTLFALLGILVLIAVGFSASRALNDLRLRDGAVEAVEANVTSDYLIAAAGHWARERGLTAVALGGAAPATGEAVDAIARARAGGDKAFALGMTRLKAGFAFKDKDRLVRDAEAAQAKLGSYRLEIDAARSACGFCSAASIS
ncbi:MAG TPA: hypothetical protein PKM48_12460, partial [Parvularculaceae bacterium]|nr:hypothetical protein [Parvularculaceae bacterium]